MIRANRFTRIVLRIPRATKVIELTIDWMQLKLGSGNLNLLEELLIHVLNLVQATLDLRPGRNWQLEFNWFGWHLCRTKWPEMFVFQFRNVL